MHRNIHQISLKEAKGRDFENFTIQHVTGVFLLSMEAKAALYLRLQEECLFPMVGGLGKTIKQSSQPIGMCMIQDSPSDSLPWDDKNEAEW